MHPLALPNNSGACGMKTGEKLRYTITNRICVCDEFLQDGDAFVKWEDDGSYDTV